ncbi:uncharacterized protein LOC143416169 isoform X4 [Maylandia zebra]|uniref:uncharacterized protein LOC143412967 isoform X3 n=1 Tax=Maylandia zebra TaxID=106582 RepID=UPI00403CF13D
MARRGLDSPLDFAAGRLDYVVERPAEEGLPEVIRILDDSDTERVSEGEYALAHHAGQRYSLWLRDQRCFTLVLSQHSALQTLNAQDGANTERYSTQKTALPQPDEKDG